MINKLHEGDAREIIDQLEDNSIQLIITSPPYWGLRDYENHPNQLGQEETPYAYIDELIRFFEKCKRVLKDDGVLFVNLADTYYGSNNGKGYQPKAEDKQVSNKGSGKSFLSYKDKSIRRKSLTGIPQRFMVRMIDQGWICRNEIIWKKNNVMPSAVKDRFTVEHENIYMFSKNEYYKFHQLKEKMKTKDTSNPRGSKGCSTPQSGRRYKSEQDKLYRNVRSVWEVNQQPLRIEHYATFPEKLATKMILCGSDEGDVVLDPFMGSRTTAKVAVRYNRNFIGIELVKRYIEFEKQRIDELFKET